MYEDRRLIIIISGFGIYGAAVVPDSGVGNTWQCLTLVLHEFLSNGLTPSRLHIIISFLTHADHVFLYLPRSLVPGSPKRVMELMHEVARCTCPYHLRRRVRRTAVISSRSCLQICRTSKRQSKTSGRRSPLRQFKNRLHIGKKRLNVVRMENGGTIQHIFR